MFYLQSSGGKIAVYDPNPKGREAVLLVHGWPLSHRMYEYQQTALLEKGYRVISLDLRGFGRSDAPAEGYGYDQMAADLYQVVQSLNLCRFVLVGFSMGGAIVLRYMRLYQGYGVKKLILLAAAAPCWTRRPDFPYGLPREKVQKLIDLCRIDRPQLCEDFSHQLFACPQSAAALRWMELTALSASGTGTLKCALALRDEDGRRDLAAVRVPTTIIQGERDQVVPPELARIQQQGIRGAKLRALAGSGHGVFYDELEKFNQIFLEEVGS